MENVGGIEPFLKDFIEWYGLFLEQIKEFELEEPGTPAFDSRKNISKPHQRIQLSLGTSVYTDDWITNWEVDVERDEQKYEMIKGTYEPLIAKEEELKVKLEELARRNNVEVKPYFKFLNFLGSEVDYEIIPLPQYDLFVTNLEFSIDDRQKMAIYLNDRSDTLYELEEGIYMFFNPIPKVPDPIHVEGWGGSEHPEGPEKGVLRFNTDLKGGFFHNKEYIFGFHVLPDYVFPGGEGHKFMGYKLSSTIHFKGEFLGTGALTTFLEMLEERTEYAETQ